MSFNPILQSQFDWSLFNGTRQKRRRERDNRLSFEIGETILECNRLYIHIYTYIYSEPDLDECVPQQ